MRVLGALLVAAAAATAVATPLPTLRLGGRAPVTGKGLLLTAPAGRSPILRVSGRKGDKVALCFTPSATASDCTTVDRGTVVTPSAAVRAACR